MLTSKLLHLDLGQIFSCGCTVKKIVSFRYNNLSRVSKTESGTSNNTYCNNFERGILTWLNQDDGVLLPLWLKAAVAAVGGLNNLINLKFPYSIKKSIYHKLVLLSNILFRQNQINFILFNISKILNKSIIRCSWVRVTISAQ